MYSAGYKNTDLCTHVFHQRGQSAKMLAPQHSRKRLGFRILCKGDTAAAGTEDVKYPSATILSVANLLNNSVYYNSPGIKLTLIKILAETVLESFNHFFRL